LKRVVGDRSLDDALEEFDVSTHSSLFRIEVGGGGVELKFPGWISVPDGEGDAYFTFDSGKSGTTLRSTL
jgi:hypothetical protein